MGTLLDDFLNFQAQTNPNPIGIEVERAEGIFVYDAKGKRYYDLTSGLAVANIGHRHPAVISAIQDQLIKYMHVMPYGEYAQEPQVKLAKKLAEVLPEQLCTSYFVNSGTEANEAALKLAKRFTNRTEIISFRNSYHGNTHGSLSVTGNENKKYAFRPLLPGIRFLDFNAIDQLNSITEKSAAVIIEPIQGDAGVRIPDIDFMRQLRAKCNQTNTLLIFDEIQTGMGRTGTLFAFEHFDIVPDILTTAKALGGGMPIGAFISSKEIMNCLTNDPILGHITTFGGHPVSCAGAYATLNLINDESLLSSINNKLLVFKSLLIHELINDVRGIGLMIAVEMDDFNTVKKVVDLCRKKGVLLFWFISCNNSFRISPPLTISEDEIRESCEVILNCLDEIAAQ